MELSQLCAAHELSQDLKVNMAQKQEDLSASNRQRLTTEAKRDKPANEMSSTGSNGAPAINKKNRLAARTAALEGNLVAAQRKAHT